MKKTALLLTLLLLSAVQCFAQYYDSLWSKWNNSSTNDLLFTHDGQYLISAHSSFIEINEALTGQMHKRFYPAGREIRLIELSPNGKYLASLDMPDGTYKGKLIIWDMEIEEAHDSILMSLSCQRMKFSADGYLILTTTFNQISGRNRILKYDLEKKNLIVIELSNHTNPDYYITSNTIALSKNGGYFAVEIIETNKYDRYKINTYLELWDAKTFQPLRTLLAYEDLEYHRGIDGLSFSDDSQLLLATIAGGENYIWDIEKDSLIKSFKFENDFLFSSEIDFFHNNDSLVLFSNKASGIYNLNSNSFLQKFQGIISEIAISTDNSLIVNNQNGWIKVFKLNGTTFKELEENKNLFPNPLGNNSIINIPVPQNKIIVVSLYNSQSKLIEELGNVVSQDNYYLIDLSKYQLTSGAYFIQVSGYGYNKTYNFIVK